MREGVPLGQINLMGKYQGIELFRFRGYPFSGNFSKKSDQAAGSSRCRRRCRAGFTRELLEGVAGDILHENQVAMIELNHRHRDGAIGWSLSLRQHLQGDRVEGGPQHLGSAGFRRPVTRLDDLDHVAGMLRIGD